MKKIISLLILPFLASCSIIFGGDYEQPKYEVLKEVEGGIELRQYDEFIVAKTVVTGDRDDASNKAFKLLAGYIFGDNKQETEMSMTAPVLLEKQTDQLWVMSFMMPSKFRIDTLPTPKDNKIIFEVFENKKLAVITFSGRWTQENFNKKANELLDFIKEENLNLNSREINAFYNPPFTLPWFRRNEIMFEVE